MGELLDFTVIGLVTASIYAIVASGLVVTYTTSGVFNFAHGATAMLAVFLYWQFTTQWNLPWFVAVLAILVVIAPAFGWFIDRVIMRGLADAPEITKIVVTLGILFGLLSVAPLVWEPQRRLVSPIFGRDSITLGTVNVTHHQLAVLIIGVLVAVGLRFLLQHTRSGTAMRAVVDSPSLTRLNGARPARSSALSWALGSSLAALAGILIADQTGLEVLTLTLLVINGYAAAVVGRLRSLPMTFVGAGILGLLESYARNFLPDNPAWFADRGIELTAGLRLGIPVIMLFVVLLLLPHAPLRAGGLQRTREAVARPGMRRSMVGFAGVILATVLISGTLSDAALLSWGRGFAWGLIMLSLVPLIGYGGQISLAPLAFAGLGAWAMGRFGAGSALVGLVAAIGITAAVGVIVALPALRLRGIYLALATLAFAVFMERVVFPQRIMFEGGSLRVARPVIGPVDLTGQRAYVIAMAVVFSAVGLLVVALRRGRFGRRLQAMKDSPAACATLGMNLTATKLAVFSFSSAIAGLGGVMLAGLHRVATPTHYELLQALPVILLAVAGGIAMVSGALVGGFMLASFAVVPNWVSETWQIAGFSARSVVENALVLAPAFLGITLGRNPNGIAHEVGSRVRALFSRRQERAEELAGVPADVETLGVDRSLTAEDIAAIEQMLHLDEEVISAAARG